jgi:hypothetical protein
MKHVLLALMLCPLPVAVAQSNADSHIRAHVPDANDFRAYFIRDASEYLSKKAGKRVVADYELLRENPTQTGVAYPKFYAWVRASDGDKRLVFEGAMRLAAIEKKRFEVTDFLTKQEIVAAPTRIEEMFPRLLLPKIREKAGIK